jgi:hypothetical protein
MKKTSLLLVLLQCSGLAYASDGPMQTWVSGGYKDGHGSMALGLRSNNIGMEVGELFGDSNSASSTASPISGTMSGIQSANFTTMEKGDVKGNSVGIDWLFFKILGLSTSVYGGMGGYFTHHNVIEQSSGSNIFTQQNYTTYNNALSAGIKYSPSEKMSLGIGFHSTRGTNINFGMRF